MGSGETVYLTTEEEILKYLEQSRLSKQSLFVYGGGKNWGYGGESSIDTSAQTLSLEKMNKILSFDKELGVVEIEPGVTQGQLEEYLEANQLPYFVPNTGAGSRGSLLGNALERGFGVAPLGDHASALVSVRGILASGEIYQSPLDEVSKELSFVFPWGVGLCTDKLISQSSWIIVTRVALQLVKKLPCSDTLVFKVPDSKIKNVIEKLRDLHFELSSNLASVKIFDSQQIQKSFYEKPLQEKYWFVFVGFYSLPSMRTSIIKIIKKKLSKESHLVVLVNQKRISLAEKVLKIFPEHVFTDLKQKLQALSEYQKMVDGHTSEIGFHVLDKGASLDKEKPFDMTTFNQGIAWFSPLCPMKFEHFNKLIHWIENKEKSAPCEFRSKTWTTLNSRCFALVVCMVFDKDKELLFWEWYNQLLIEMKAQGFIPYRFPIQSFPTLQQQLLPEHFKRVSKIEKCLDPDSLLQRNRYHS